MYCRCPTSRDLGLALYSISDRHWGFRFSVPKFNGYDTLYLTCLSYICDVYADGKPFCDRTCIDPKKRVKRRPQMTQQMPDDLKEFLGREFTIMDLGSGPLIYANGTMSFTGLISPPETMHGKT